MGRTGLVLVVLAAGGCGFAGRGGGIDGHGHGDGSGPVVDADPAAPDADPAAPDARRPPDAPVAPVDADPCQAPYVRSSHGCHAFLAVMGDATAAAAACQGIGGGLPIIEDAAESAYIGTTALGTDPNLRVWIGLSLQGGVWTWRNGAAATFTNWVSGEPNGSGPCAVSRFDGSWGDRLCTDTPFSVVCEKP